MAIVTLPTIGFDSLTRKVVCVAGTFNIAGTAIIDPVTGDPAIPPFKDALRLHVVNPDIPGRLDWFNPDVRAYPVVEGETVEFDLGLEYLATDIDFNSTSISPVGQQLVVVQFQKDATYDSVYGNIVVDRTESGDFTQYMTSNTLGIVTDAWFPYVEPEPDSYEMRDGRRRRVVHRVKPALDLPGHVPVTPIV
jgi:hypothetical protein